MAINSVSRRQRHSVPVKETQHPGIDAGCTAALGIAAPRAVAHNRGVRARLTPFVTANGPI